MNFSHLPISTSASSTLHIDKRAAWPDDVRAFRLSSFNAQHKGIPPLVLIGHKASETVRWLGAAMVRRRGCGRRQAARVAKRVEV